MDLIKERSFQRLLQETSEYKRNEMNYVKDSYWEDMESNYGIEEYIYQNVHELADKIEKATQISSDVSKDLAVEAYRIFLSDNRLNEKEENDNIGLPDFVYRL